MSFSSDLKDELIKLKIRTDEEKRAMLAALTHTAGAMTLSSGFGLGVQYMTENSNVAKLVAKLAKALYNIDAAIGVKENTQLKNRYYMTLLRGENCKTLLEDVGYLAKDDNDESFEIGHVDASLLDNEDKQRAFIRGAFLGSGSVNAPDKGYHAEIICRYERFARELSDILSNYYIDAKLTDRKSQSVLYIKEGDKVSDLIKLLGASDAAMQFEEVRLFRGVKNDLNRRRNFEDANMNKSATASAKQLVDIELIKSVMPLSSLSKPLYEAAEARLNNPEANLADLAQMLNVGKSGVNHRFIKLAAIADSIRNGEKV
ncbi:MAG: DNA-binding protein WhiA [Clostridia bacterium]|nr:DNA-binding protein WhiA [Clostridia bacterium]